jgi:cobalt-zinc-cadmium efflux system membrane fusion protein
VADLSTLWIESDLFEKDLGKVKVGAQAAVTVSAYPGEVFKGQLTYISSTMDKETRTVKARVEVPNSDGRLKPEMFATVAIGSGGSTKALIVPEGAVLLLQGQPTVFVAESGGFEPRAVEVGERTQGYAVLKSGVAAGESMVVSGAYALKARLLKSQIGDAD